MTKCIKCNQRRGRGNPPTCNECYTSVLHEQAENPSTLDYVLESPAIQRLVDRGLDAINEATNRVLGRVDGYARIAMQMAAQQQQKQTPSEPPKRSAREVLHFGPDELLTKEKVKQRKRALASMVHPDKAGSVEAMQAINEAAEKLLKEINA